MVPDVCVGRHGDESLDEGRGLRPLQVDLLGVGPLLLRGGHPQVLLLRCGALLLGQEPSLGPR